MTNRNYVHVYEHHNYNLYFFNEFSDKATLTTVQWPYSSFKRTTGLATEHHQNLKGNL